MTLSHTKAKKKHSLHFKTKNRIPTFKGSCFLIFPQKQRENRGNRCSLVPFLSEIKLNPEQPITKLFFCKKWSIFVSKMSLVAIGLRPFL